MRTNMVVGETVYGEQHCVYVGPSADRALAVYADLRQAGGSWSDHGTAYPKPMKFVKAICCIDPKTSKHCSFPP